MWLPNNFSSVAPELASKATGLCPEGHQTGDDVVVVERFETKAPIKLSITINKNKSILVATN
jgi:hypothetical protein